MRFEADEFRNEPRNVIIAWLPTLLAIGGPDAGTRHRYRRRRHRVIVADSYRRLVDTYGTEAALEERERYR